MMRILLVFFLLSSTLTFGQEFSFTTFAQEKGIEHPYIYSIQQNSEGYLCFTTSEGAYQFDGINFQRIDSNKEIKEPFFKSIFISKDNSTYLGSNSGGIYRYNKGKLVFKYEDKVNTTPVISILQSDDFVYACYQDGQIVELSMDNKIIKYQLEEGHLYTTFENYSNGFVAGFEEGFKTFKLSNRRVTNTRVVKVMGDEVISLCYNKAGLFVGTSNNGLYVYDFNRQLKKINLGDDIDQASIKSICCDKLNSIWISAYGLGVFEIKRNTETGGYYQRTELSKSQGIPSVFVTDIFLDRESNVWIGSLGQGLIRLNSNFLVQYGLKNLGLGTYVYSIAGNRKQFCGMENGVAIIDAMNDTVYPWSMNKFLPKDRILAVAFDVAKNTLYIGTKNNGLFSYTEGDSKPKGIELSADNLSKAVRHLNLVNDKLYISTLNGLFQMNLVTGEKRVFNAADGLPHNAINSTFLKTDGKLLIATASSGIFYLKDNKIEQEKTGQSFGMLDILAFVEDRRGGIWMATNGQGLLHLRNQKLTQINKEKGMYSNFIYQLSLDKKNTIWCGHNGGLSRVNMNENVVQRFDERNKIKMDFCPNASNTDMEFNVWFGTNEGALKFSYFHDKFSNQTIEPIIVSIHSNNKLVESAEMMYLPFGKNNLKVTFRAISLSNPGEVYYQFRISEYENKWSEPSLDNFVELNNLPDGEFVLEVRSRIGNGEWSKSYKLLNLTVGKPIWKEWKFLVGFSIIIVGLIAILINYRTQSLKRQKDELEVKLAIRTQEIEQQKNQIKLQFKETQDSINYGVRIQKSLLPDEESLREIVPDSFIFLQPKDKVSGDFYYFEKFGNRVVITAADATGHGVPGAFISLIGFVLLKELINRKEVENPARLLTILDQELNKSLHQYNGTGDGKDGMDMAICEIDFDTLKLKMASALRPIWIFRNGEFEKIRSSKSTIGGGMNGKDAPEKEFDLEERQLQKGDTIYMFSDGYVDQFGSELNKKLMTKRFLDLIQSNNDRPMSEQREIIANFLHQWKGDLEQTDDILVIGLRV